MARFRFAPDHTNTGVTGTETLGTGPNGSAEFRSAWPKVIKRTVSGKGYEDVHRQRAPTAATTPSAPTTGARRTALTTGAPDPPWMPGARGTGQRRQARGVVGLSADTRKRPVRPGAPGGWRCAVWARLIVTSAAACRVAAAAAVSWARGRPARRSCSSDLGIHGAGRLSRGRPASATRRLGGLISHAEKTVPWRENSPRAHHRFVLRHESVPLSKASTRYDPDTGGGHHRFPGNGVVPFPGIAKPATRSWRRRVPLARPTIPVRLTRSSTRSCTSNRPASWRERSCTSTAV